MAKEKPVRLDLTDMSTGAAIAAINAKYGDNTMILARKALGVGVSFVSSGCYALDFSLGGGFPENRIIEIRGPFSAAKTTLALCGAAAFQRRYPADEEDGLVIFVDVEKSLIVEYASALGVDPDRMAIVNPDSGEQAVDVISDLMGMNRPIYMIVDSIAAMVPTAEIEGSMDQQYMGLHPRLINRMMRVATSRLKRSLYKRNAPRTTIVALNQIREKIGVMYGNPETTPGGRGKDFFYSVMIRLSSASSEKIIEEVTRNGIKRKILVAISIHYNINKNKVGGSQFEEGVFKFFVRKHKHYEPYSFNNDEVLLKMGLFYDVIRITKAGLIASDGTRLAKKPAIAMKQLAKMPKLQRRLYREISAKIIRERELSGKSQTKTIEILTK